MQGTQGNMGSIPGSGRSLEKEMTTHSSMLAWEIPPTEEPGGLQSWDCRRVRHDLVTKQQAAAAAKSLQSCPTLCDPRDGSPPGSPVPGILQARTLDWVAISFSNAWEWKVKVKSLSRVQLFVTPWTAAHQAPPPWDFPGKSTGVGCHHLLRNNRQLYLISYNNLSWTRIWKRIYIYTHILTGSFCCTPNTILQLNYSSITKKKND